MTRKQVVRFTGTGPAWPASYVGFYSDSGATTPVTVYSDQIASTVLASGKTGSSPVRRLRADNLGTVPPPALGIGLYVDSSVTTLYARPETVTGVAISGAAAVSVASYGPDGPITPIDPSQQSAGYAPIASVPTVVIGVGTADSAAVLAAFNSMKVAGHATGRLKLKGTIALDTPLVLDGGYSAVTSGANWLSGSTEGFVLDCSDALLVPAAGVGVAVTVKGFYGAQVSARFKGGGYGHTVTSGAAITSGQQTLTLPAGFSPAVGQYFRVEGAGASAEVPLTGQITAVASPTSVTVDIVAGTTVSNAQVFVGDIGLRIANLLNAEVDVYANGFAGLVSYLDGTSSANQVTQSTLKNLKTQSCGQALGWRNVAGGFGAILDVWDDSNVNGSVFDTAADITIAHWESYSISSQPVGLLFNQCSDFGVATISLGDSAAVLCKIVGGDFGSINRLRTGGSPILANGSSVIVGTQLVDIHSINIDTLQTQHCLKGLHIRGGTNKIHVGSHLSLTSDTIPVYIEAGVSSSAPTLVNIGGYWRFNYDEVIYIASTITGGQINLSGMIDNSINQHALAANYAVDCQSTACVVNIAGLTQKFRSVLAAGVFCANPGNVRGIERASVQNASIVAANRFTWPHHIWITELMKGSSTGPINEVQAITINPQATGGTFTLTWGGQTTSALAYNISAAALQTALTGLSSIGAGNVTVTQVDSTQPYIVTFVGSLAALARAFITSTSSITGTANLPATIASGTPQQNYTDRTLVLYVKGRFQPSSGTPTAELDFSVGPSGSTVLAVGYATEKYFATAPNDRDLWFQFEVPPWHFFSFNLTAVTLLVYGEYK